MARRITTFEEFWPCFVGRHRSASCRKWHFVGTTCGIVFTLAFLLTWSWWSLALAALGWIVPGSVGHLVFEKNRPVTLGHPLWSLAADLTMYGKMWTGQMDAEITRVADPLA